MTKASPKRTELLAHPWPRVLDRQHLSAMSVAQFDRYIKRLAVQTRRAVGAHAHEGWFPDQSLPPYDSRSNQHWSQSEDAYLMGASGSPQEIAWALRRSPKAVRQRRCRLLAQRVPGASP